MLSIFHHSFSEWLLDVKHCTRRFLCNAIAGHTALAMYYTLRARRLTPVEIHCLVLHMTRLEQHHNLMRYFVLPILMEYFCSTIFHIYFVFSDVKPTIDSTQDQNVEKALPSSTTYSNFKSIEGDDPNSLDFHTLILLWILDSGCRIETSLKRQVDNIGKELGGLAWGTNNQNPIDSKYNDKLLNKSPSFLSSTDNMPRHSSNYSLGM